MNEKQCLKVVKYIISQHNILYIENDRVFHNVKEIAFEGSMQDTVLNKKM